MYCKNCGTEIEENTVACPGCLTPPAKGKKFCPHCGEAIELDQVLCIKCGRMTSNPTVKNLEESNVLGLIKEKIAGLLSQISVGKLSPNSLANSLMSSNIVVKALYVLSYILGVGIGIGLIFFWVKNWSLVYRGHFFMGLGVCVFQLTALVAIFYMIRIYSVRLKNGLAFKDSQYIIMPWVCLILTTLGDMFFVGSVIISVPSIFLRLAYHTSIGMAFLSPIICIAAGTLAVLIIRLIVELISLFYCIANDVDFIKRQQEK